MELTATQQAAIKKVREGMAAVAAAWREGDEYLTEIERSPGRRVAPATSAQVDAAIAEWGQRRQAIVEAANTLPGG